MPLDPNKLASQLATLTPVGTEPEAIDHLVNAWANYFQSASVAAATIGPGTLSPALTAMKGALAGLSQPGVGALKIQSAIQAFWTTLVPLSPTVWLLPPAVAAPGTAPPTISAIASALQVAFDANLAVKADLPTAAQRVAQVLHGQGGLGGVVVLTPPAGPPVPTPIL